MEAVIYNFNIMRSLSKQYLQQVNKDSDPDCTTSILYSAFSLEGYLNYAGEKLFTCWTEIEKSLSPIAKIKLIAEELEVEVNFGIRPFQTVKQVFNVRNDVGHPKAELANGDYSSKENLPKPVWEKNSTIQLAERAIEDFGNLIYEKFGGLDIQKRKNFDSQPNKTLERNI